MSDKVTASLVVCIMLCGSILAFIPVVSDESSAATEREFTANKTVQIGESFSVRIDGSTSLTNTLSKKVGSFTGAPTGVSYEVTEIKGSGYGQTYSYSSVVTISGLVNVPGTYNIVLRIGYSYNYSESIVEYYKLNLTVIDPAKTVYFVDADGSTLASSQHAVTMTLPSANKSGYMFDGWYTSASGGTRVGGAGDSYTPSSNITLYAHWTEIRTNFFATVYYDANGGSGEPATQSDYIYAASPSGSATFTIPNTVPTRTYYNFLGWSTSSSASVAPYQPGGSISVAYGNEVRLYAVWSEIVPEITSSLPEVFVVVGDSWSYDVSYTPETATLSVTGASWLNVSGDRIIGTTSVSGTYDVTVIVTYGSQSDMQTFTLIVVDRLSFESAPTGSILISPA